MNLEDVREYAKFLHRKQQYDQYPYSFHLQSVELVARFFQNTETSKVLNFDHLFKACWLHDSIEDCGITTKILDKDGIETEVINLVWAVTDGEGKSRKERKAIMYEKCQHNVGATFLKLCDRIANVEHGIKSGSSLTFMYRKEQEEFKTKLFTEVTGYEILSPMWTYLETLLNL